MTINEAQDAVIGEFEDFTDWMDKYQMLIDLGNELEPLDEQYKNEQNLIDGCQSRVWLQCDYVEGKLIFTADSDALITKGIIALLIRVLSNHTPQEIIDADLYFIEQIGLRQHLSPTRSNGLLSMVTKIKAYAVGFSLQKEEPPQPLRKEGSADKKTIHKLTYYFYKEPKRTLHNIGVSRYSRPSLWGRGRGRGW